MSSSLVVVGYLYVVGISAYPRKAHAVVPVDPDGVLALSVASQLLKPVARRSLRSSTFVAALSTRSFDKALSLNSVGTAFDLRPRKSLSVSLSAKLFITSVY
jgi:hypothetical protein